MVMVMVESWLWLGYGLGWVGRIIKHPEPHQMYLCLWLWVVLFITMLKIGVESSDVMYDVMYGLVESAAL